MAIRFNTDGLTGSIEIGPQTTDGWRDCFVSVGSFGFSAEYTCALREEELRSLLDKLDTAVKNLGQVQEVEFSALERGFALKLQLDKGGHVEGSYEFGRDWRGPFLSGAFSADQTHLVGWAKDLKAALN